MNIHKLSKTLPWSEESIVCSRPVLGWEIQNTLAVWDLSVPGVCRGLALFRNVLQICRWWQSYLDIKLRDETVLSSVFCQMIWMKWTAFWLHSTHSWYTLHYSPKWTLIYYNFMLVRNFYDQYIFSIQFLKIKI